MRPEFAPDRAVGADVPAASVLPNFESDWAPIVRPRRRGCESCGATGPRTIFVPNAHGGGRRLCPDCLRVFDVLRAKEVTA